MDRKQFFKEMACLALEVFEKVPAAKTLMQSEKLRPPGAHPNEAEFLKKCTGCDACMIACPVHAIVIEDREKRDPLLYFKQNPCIKCPGTPCITSCSTGALDKAFGTYQRPL